MTRSSNIRYKHTRRVGHFRVIVGGEDVGEVYQYQTYAAGHPPWTSWTYRGGGGRGGWPTLEQAARALIGGAA